MLGFISKKTKVTLEYDVNYLNDQILWVNFGVLKTISTILVFALLLTICQEWMAVTSFKIQQAEIAKKYCVNKNVKGSACNGNCWLSSMLKKIHNESSEKAVLQQIERQVYIPLEIGFALTSWAQIEQSSLFKRSRSYNFLVEFDIFHPPRMIG